MIYGCGNQESRFEEILGVQNMPVLLMLVGMVRS